MFQPTKEQKRAIESDNGKILVSASAGTGKTTVMINRIVRLLAEGKVKPEELLVITFTKAAAAEMKERLLAELSARPSMHKELSELSSATIGTIHSFCTQLLRTYFYVAGIEPDFTVMDEWKNSSVKKRVMKKIFDEYYAKGDEVFLELIRITGKRNDSGLEEIILGMLSFRDCIPDFDKYIKKNDDYPSMFAFFTDKLKEYALLSIKYYSERASFLLKRFENSEKVASALRNFIDVLNVGYDFDIFELRDYFNTNKFVYLRLSNGDSSLDEEGKKAYKELKETFNKDIGTYFKALSELNKEDAFARFGQNKVFCDKFKEILRKFDAGYEKEKNESGFLDFSSLERLTMEILKNEEVLKAVKSRYSFVFVDEYQDVNDVQEWIISCVSENANAFMVGDVKQCIYGFRMSEPENFRKRRKLFACTGGENIDLNGNFRSDGRILNFVNRVFSPIMTEDFGGCDYKNEAMLTGSVSAESEKASGVHIIRYEKKPKSEKSVREKITEGLIYEIGSDTTDFAPEGKIIAEKIRELVGTEIQIGEEKKILSFSDITVLARTKDKLSEVHDALIRENVPAKLSASDGLLRNDDIKHLMSLLSIIYDYTDDISMYNVLTGFFGGFTHDEVCAISASSDEGCLYDKVKLNYMNPKCEAFIRSYNRYTLMSIGYTADVLVEKAIDLTGFREYVFSLERGSERISFIDSFLQAIDGLPECRTVNGMLNFMSDSEIDGSVIAMNDEDAVKLMTIHGSKGLEFPVVFLAGTDRRFNNDADTVLCDKEGGITMKTYDREEMKVYDNVAHSANLIIKRRRDAEEELRLLYVALTRAKYGLFITQAISEFKDKRPDGVDSASPWLSRLFYSDGESSHSGKEVSYSIEYVPYAEEAVRLPSPRERYLDRANRLVFPVNKEITEEAEYLKSKLQPEKESIFIPIKVVSSKLKKEFVIPGEKDNDFVIIDGESKPKFLAGPFVDMEAKIEVLKKQKINAELGTAYHKILECIRLNVTDRETIEFYAKELLKEGFIEEEIYDRLDFDVIIRAVNDKKLRDLIEGNELYFEQRFVSWQKVTDLVPDVNTQESTILQGAIDLLVFNGEQKKIAIVDYKYTNSLFNLRERYFLQLNSYCLAVKKIYPDYEVSAYIYALKQNKLEKLCC